MKKNTIDESLVCEPAVQYGGQDSVASNATMIVNNEISICHDLKEKGYMTVSEYFDKVKNALDLRYENL